MHLKVHEISDSILKFAPEVGCCDGAKNEGTTKWGMVWNKEGSWQPHDGLAESHLPVLGLGPCACKCWILGEKDTRAYWLLLVDFSKFLQQRDEL